MKITASNGFALLPLWLLLCGQKGLFAAVLLSAAVHEGGHLLAVYGLGGSVKQLHFSCLGAEMLLTREMSYGQDFFVALAGPLCSFLLAVLCPIRLISGVSLLFCLCNLLPLHFLDGGRCLWSGLSALWPCLPWERLALLTDITLSMLLLLFAVGLWAVRGSWLLVPFSLGAAIFTVAKRGEIV